MFYDVYNKLCKNKNMSATAVALTLGISRGTVSAWKNKGITPNGDTLQKVADYFDVTIDYLLGKDQIKNTSDEQSEVDEIVEVLKNNPGMRILFSKTRNATKEDIEKVIKMLEIMRGDD